MIQFYKKASKRRIRVDGSTEGQHYVVYKPGETLPEMTFSSSSLSGSAVVFKESAAMRSTGGHSFRASPVLDIFAGEQVVVWLYPGTRIYHWVRVFFGVICDLSKR